MRTGQGFRSVASIPALKRASGIEHRPIPFRYVWPSELDLMAQLAGLRLRGRFGGWSDEPFTAVSRSHVSVWEAS